MAFYKFFGIALSKRIYLKSDLLMITFFPPLFIETDQ